MSSSGYMLLSLRRLFHGLRDRTSKSGNGDLATLTLLDLLAAFDPVDHDRPCTRKWYRSSARAARSVSAHARRRHSDRRSARVISSWWRGQVKTSKSVCFVVISTACGPCRMLLFRLIAGSIKSTERHWFPVKYNFQDGCHDLKVRSRHNGRLAYRLQPAAIVCS